MHGVWVVYCQSWVTLYSTDRWGWDIFHSNYNIKHMGEASRFGRYFICFVIISPSRPPC